MLFKIPMGTRRNFRKICEYIRANTYRGQGRNVAVFHMNSFLQGSPQIFCMGPLLCTTRATYPAHLLLLDLMRWTKQGAGMVDRRGAYKLFSKQARIVKAIFFADDNYALHQCRYKCITHNCVCMCYTYLILIHIHINIYIYIL
jgi:hypothetical protein